MNKSRYKLYKQGKKWVITAVAATSIGIGGYTLTNPNLVHADAGQLAVLSSQTIVNDSEFYKMADRLSMAAKNNTITNSDEANYESFKAALAAYEIAKGTYSTVYNDINSIVKQGYASNFPSYLVSTQLEMLNMSFNSLYKEMIDAYNTHDNTSALSMLERTVMLASGAANMYANGSGSVANIVSKDSSVAASANSAISYIISSYNAYKNRVRYSQSSSAIASIAPAASENVPNSTPNNDASYWQNMANSLSAEMSKKSNDKSVATFAPSSSAETSVAYSTATSVTSSATSSSAIDSSAVSSAATSYSSSASSSADPAYTPSFTNHSSNSSAKPKNDVYKNFYLSLKKKAVKDVTSNKNRVAKYQKAYKNTKNKQQRAKKLKQYRDAKHKLNASQKHLKALNAKSLK